MLMETAAQFPGTVLLLNGDRHRFIIDHPFAALADQINDNNQWQVPGPLARARLKRFMRIQSFGWPFTAHHIIVEATSTTPAAGDADPALKLVVATRVLSDEPPN